MRDTMGMQGIHSFSQLQHQVHAIFMIQSICKGLEGLPRVPTDQERGVGADKDTQ